MLSLKLGVFGLYLLTISHSTDSFVLLTANIEDVKQIAKRFISDDLAIRIADFLAQATGQSVPDVSEENEQNVKKIQDVSDGDTYQFKKIARYGVSSKWLGPQSRPTPPQISPDAFNIKNLESIVPDLEIASQRPQEPQVPPEIKPTQKSPKRIIKIKKHRLKPKVQPAGERISHRPINRFKNVKNRPRSKAKVPSEKNKERAPKLHKRPKQPLQEEPLGAHESKDFHVNLNADEDEDIAPPVTDKQAQKDTGHKLSRVSEKKVKKKRVRHRTQERFALLSNDNETIAKIGQTVMMDGKGTNVQRSNLDLTTEKKKEEFDQYDNIQGHTGQTVTPASSGAIMPIAPDTRKQVEVMTKIEPEIPNIMPERELGKKGLQ